MGDAPLNEDLLEDSSNRSRSVRPRTSAVIGALLLLFSVPAILLAQDGEPADPATAAVRGRFTSAEGRPLEGAIVSIVGESQTAFTDANGDYFLSGLTARTDAPIRAVSRAGESASAVITLVAGEETQQDLVLLGGGTEVVIEAEKAGATLEKIQLTRQFASKIEDIIGSEELSKSAAGDVAQAVAQLPAVTIVGGRFAYVRGLGDRYSQTLLDGSSLPSPEPDRRTVPLDLLPLSLIDSVSVAKTYSAELPGEFAGGSIQATTVGIPVGRFIKFSVSGRYRDGTTFRQFETYEGGRFDAFGYDDGTRELPSAVPSQQVVGGAGGLSDSQLRTIGSSFSSVWSPDTTTAPLDGSVGVSFGNAWDLGGTMRLGVIGSASYANSYLYVGDEERNVITLSPTMGLNQISTYTIDPSSHEVELAALLSTTLEISPTQSITWRNLLSRASEDRVQLQSGFDGQNQTADVQFTRLQYVERLLANTQLSGKHLFIGDVLLNWRTAASLTERDQPDTRQNRYVDLNDNGVFNWTSATSSGIRHFYFQSDTVYDLGFDVAIPFNPFDVEEKRDPDPDRLEPGQYVKVGAAWMDRERELNTRKFRYNGFLSTLDTTLPPEQLITPENIANGLFVIREETRPTDNYDASQNLIAGYASTSFRVSDDVRLSGGVRVESSEQIVETFDLFGSDTVRAELDDTDVLPALNATWEFAENQQLRVGVSQTVSRPEFRELAEFEYSDVEGGFGVVGNPDLERALLQNYDIRWEWFPSDSEILSASIFAKTFDQPIEQVKLPTGGSPLTSFDNADSAILYGFEVEGRKNLGFLGDFWELFTLRGNFALIESEVEIADDPLTLQTSDSRPLQGQPEYSANFALFFDDPISGFSASVLANTFGERIDSVGTGGIPDFYEQPRLQLDVILTQKFKNQSQLKLTLANLLDEPVEITSGGLVQRKYKTGTTIGVSYSVEF